MKMVLIAVAFVVAGEDGSSDLDRWITRRRQLRSECADDTESVAPMYGGYQKAHKITSDKAFIGFKNLQAIG